MKRLPPPSAPRFWTTRRGGGMVYGFDRNGKEKNHEEEKFFNSHHPATHREWQGKQAGQDADAEEVGLAPGASFFSAEG